MPEDVGSIVDWYGPYREQHGLDVVTVARRAAHADYGGGLYAAIGHGESVRRGPRTLLYVGVGESLEHRLRNDHHVLSRLSVSDVWLGVVASPGIPGPRRKKVEPHSDIVEWAMAYFLRIPFNQKKTARPPGTSCVILNRWWDKADDSAARRPVSRWADVIEWNRETRTANLCWFGPRPRVVRMDEHAVIRRRVS